MTESNKITVISFATMLFIGWYGGINYCERSPFNSAYISVSMIISWLIIFAMSAENK